eukprot:3180232-Amphidinium_carterae.1
MSTLGFCMFLSKRGILCCWAASLQSRDECLVASLSQNLDHALEREPLWDILATTEAATEFCAREFHHLEALLLCRTFLDVAK